MTFAEQLTYLPLLQRRASHPAGLLVGAAMAHINGRQQRQLSKAKDYKRNTDAEVQWTGKTTAVASPNPSQTKPPVDLMRDFCDNARLCLPRVTTMTCGPLITEGWEQRLQLRWRRPTHHRNPQ